MALNAANVRVAVTGAVYVGTALATAPADATTALSANWTDLGFVSEDGVSEERERDTETIKAWQNATVVREVVTEASLRYTFTCIETKKEVVETFYGATASADGKIVINPGAQGGAKPLVIDVIDGAQTIRIYAPAAELTEVGEQVYASGEPVGYEMTFTCYHDGTLGGSVAKWYSALDTTP